MFDSQLDALIAEIKKKKELQGLQDDFVREQIVRFLQQEPKIHQQLQNNFNPKSKAYRVILKSVRAQLRRVYGLFRDDQKKRKKLVQELLNASPAKRSFFIEQILTTHSSTQERLSIYPELYPKIFALTGKPKSILDLGAGINPFSLPYMKLKNCTYHAYDLNEEEMDSINRYFQLLHQENSSFRGKAEVADITKAQFPAADLALLFKITDVIDKGKGHSKTEELLKKIPAKFVVISFSTKTMSGKAMTAPRRNWVEWLCKRLGYNYTILEFENEIFYVVKK